MFAGKYVNLAGRNYLKDGRGIHETRILHLLERAYGILHSHGAARAIEAQHTVRECRLCRQHTRRHPVFMVMIAAARAVVVFMVVLMVPVVMPVVIPVVMPVVMLVVVPTLQVLMPALAVLTPVVMPALTVVVMVLVSVRRHLNPPP